MGEKLFTHLHVHTEYSLLDGAARIQELVKKASELGMKSIAITDHGAMYGVIEFYKQARKVGIKPILGFEAYVTPFSMYDKDPQKNKNLFHLILLAKNYEGFKNIMKICSEGFVNGFYYKPRVDYELLKKYSGGIIALSACLAGEVQDALLNNNYQKAKEKALMYRDIFGADNFYLEMQDHGMDEQKIVNRALIELSNETNIPLVCTNDVHYIDKKDAKYHDILLCVQMQKTVDEERMRFPSDEFYLKSYDEMELIFPKNAINNSNIIADRCNVEIDFDTVHLPEFEIPKEYSKIEYFKNLCQTGLKNRYHEITDEIQKRLDYEISIIEQMGYIDYFLIVWDFIKYAKDNDIMVGPGRGSGAGSLVAYSLRITDIDPIKNKLIFERFLNPERVSMPDIDVDFCYERREEVIDYVIKKYGEDRVAQIVTFGTMAARAAIRDVGRALNMSYKDVDTVARKIPMALGMTISKALETDKSFMELYENDSNVRELVDISRKLEGLPRHTSTHAAGVLISRDEVTEYVPLSRNKDIITTQFNMVELEELGLLKMDFLGLRTLTVIQDTIKLIKKLYNKDISFDNCEYDDENVFKMFAKADTLGIFQFESAGMRSFLKEFKPSRFEDLAAANALYRPGPMGQIPIYIHNSHHPEEVTYLHPLLEASLKETYGCMIYQEQVMQIARDIAGFSMGRSDLLRRAMGKKKMDIMKKEREHFIHGEDDENGNIVINGALRNGVSEQIANQIYDLMIEFAKYAFPKAHSVAYAVVAYRCAWLKYYYPVEFMASQITSIIGNSNSVALYIGECKRLGIKILPPDINSSEDKFTVIDKKIRFGLKAVKNVGINVIQEIIRERNKNGLFKSFFDFCNRVDTMVLNKRQIESLIRCGAFDSLGYKRAQLISVYDRIIDGILYQRRKNVEGQVSLFDSSIISFDSGINDNVLPDVPEFSNKDLLMMEKEMLGVYVSGHPLSLYEEILAKNTSINTNDIFEALEKMKNSEEPDLKDGQRVVVGGIIVKKQTKITKNDNMMAFFTLEDFYGNIDIVAFPKIYNKYLNLIQTDNIVLIDGNINISEDDTPKIICNSIKNVSEIKNIEKLYIRLKDKKHYSDIKRELYSIFQEFKGKNEIVIFIEEEKLKMVVPKTFNVDLKNKELINKLMLLLGKENVILK